MSLLGECGVRVFLLLWFCMLVLIYPDGPLSLFLLRLRPIDGGRLNGLWAFGGKWDGKEGGVVSTCRERQ